MKTRQWLSTDAVRFEVGELGGDAASGSAVPILPRQLHTELSRFLSNLPKIKYIGGAQFTTPVLSDIIFLNRLQTF